MAMRINRRMFLGSTAATATVEWSAPRLDAADAGAKTGPNETVHVGLIGCGTRGGSGR